MLQCTCNQHITTPLHRQAANDALQQAWEAACAQQKQQRVDAQQALDAAERAYDEAMTQQQADRARVDIAAAQKALAEAHALQVVCWTMVVQGVCIQSTVLS